MQTALDLKNEWRSMIRQKVRGFQALMLQVLWATSLPVNVWGRLYWVAIDIFPMQQLNTTGFVPVTYFAAILRSEDAEANRAVHI